MVLEISFYKDKSKKTQFHASLLENGLNIFWFGIFQVLTSYWWVMEPKVVLYMYIKVWIIIIIGILDWYLISSMIGGQRIMIDGSNI
jgi:hypothetical protein